VTGSEERPAPGEEVVAVGIIYDRAKKKVLLGKRSREPAKGVWALPGGVVNVEQGETEKAGLLREIGEELGKRFQVEFLHGKPTAIVKANYRQTTRERRIHAVHYLLKPIGGEPEALDGTDEILWGDETECADLYRRKILLEASAEAIENTLGWEIRQN